MEFQFRWEIPIEYITNSSVRQPTREVLCLYTSPGWRSSIITYLKDGILPNDRVEAGNSRYILLDHRYILLRDILYKKSYFSLHPDPYLRCLGSEDARKMMQEIHDGDCENHVEDALSPTRSSTKGTTGPRCSTMPTIM